jgi:hypothetical protein
MNIVKNVMVVSVFIIFLSASCTVILTVKTDPEYATIYSGGRNFGRSPVRLEFNTRPSKYVANGGTPLANIRARWLSGAETDTNLVVYTRGEGNEFEVTLERPASFPNADTDVRYVIERTTKENAIEKKD